MKTRFCFILTSLTVWTLMFLPGPHFADAQRAETVRPIVRLIYFLPRDRSPQPDIDEKFDKLIKEVQEVFAGQMDYYGFGRKTFRFETDATGKAVVHHVKSRFKDAYFHNQAGKVWEEIDEKFDTSTNIYLTALDVSTEDIDGFCGFGCPHGAFGGSVLIPASGWCFEDPSVTIHELGHAFGLLHDFRNNLKPWIDLYTKIEPMTNSPCAVEWLDAHPCFNTHQDDFNGPTTIEMVSPGTTRPDGIPPRLKITDPDGLHQVQFFATVEYLNAPDWGILGCKSLDGSSAVVEFPTTRVPMMADSKPLAVKTDFVMLQVIDQDGNFSREHFYLQAGPKIEGPWLWMIAPTRKLGSAAATSGIDYLAEVSGGAVTEKQIATKGATAGDAVGDKVWTPGKIAPTGDDNITDLVNAIGLGEGDINEHVAYGSITLESSRTQKTTMHVGSDDAVKVWLNGVLVHDNPVDRPASGYQENFPVTLKQGKNILLVAVYEGLGYWSGFFGFDNGTDYRLPAVPIVLVERFQRPPMYWIDIQTGGLHTLIETSVERLVPRVQNATHLAADVAAGKIYWVEKTGKKTSKIRRANPDGSAVKLVKDLTSVVLALAVDPVNRKLYLANAWGKLQRMNPDGSDFQPNFITDLKTPTAIAVLGEKLYWTEEESIRRSNLNGENIEDVAVGLGTPTSIALVGVPEGAPIPAAPTALAVHPDQTVLLANYPNPFNPETWLPYQLAKPADVTVTIYDINGRIVQDVDLGHQRAGIYQSRGRAAYWDGRNAVGEPVASGVYFYTLTAGEFTATRRMLIRK